MRTTIFALFVLASIPVAGSAAGFNGPYVGMEVGRVAGKDQGTEFLSGVFANWTTETSPTGELYGVLGGYGWSVGDNFLLGVEADYEHRSADDDAFYKFGGVTDPRYSIEADLKSAYSLRLRFGYVFNNARTVAYVTGGYAAADIERTYRDNTISTSLTVSNTQRGWVAGLGLEHLVGRNLSVRLEYRAADYGDVTIDTASLWGAPYVELQEYDEQSVRAGIVYRF
jgi:outer membrane immunogenic protein